MIMLSEVKNKRAREGLENCKHEALLSKELVTIDTNMNLENELSALNKVQYDAVSYTHLTLPTNREV